MARITVEDCLKKVNNRFTLIHMASQRVRQLRKGNEQTIQSKNRDVVVSLREIAAGTVEIMEETNQLNLTAEPMDLLIEEPEVIETEGDEESSEKDKSEETEAEGN